MILQYGFFSLDEEALNEHAIDDPEEVARYVEMWGTFTYLKNSWIFPFCAFISIPTLK